MWKSLLNRGGISSGRLGYLIVVVLFVICVADGLFLFTWLTVKFSKFPETVGGIKSLSEIIGGFAVLLFGVTRGTEMGKKGGSSADGTTDSQRSTSNSPQVKP